MSVHQSDSFVDFGKNNKPPMTSNKECCSLCIGAYKDSDLDKGICRNNGCECHTKESDWEKELTTYWRHDSSIGGYLQLKDFITSLLTKQKASTLKEVREVIESLKDEEDTEARGWDLFFHGDNKKVNKHCCPGDDYGVVYEKALTDLLTKLEEMN